MPYILSTRSPLRIYYRLNSGPDKGLTVSLWTRARSSKTPKPNDSKLLNLSYLNLRGAIFLQVRLPLTGMRIGLDRCTLWIWGRRWDVLSLTIGRNISDRIHSTPMD